MCWELLQGDVSDAEFFKLIWPQRWFLLNIFPKAHVEGTTLGKLLSSSGFMVSASERVTPTLKSLQTSNDLSDAPWADLGPCTYVCIFWNWSEVLTEDVWKYEVHFSRHVLKQTPSFFLSKPDSLLCLVDCQSTWLCLSMPTLTKTVTSNSLCSTFVSHSCKISCVYMCGHPHLFMQDVPKLLHSIPLTGYS